MISYYKKLVIINGHFKCQQNLKNSTLQQNLVRRCMHFQLHAILTTSTCIQLLSTIVSAHILSRRIHNSQKKNISLNKKSKSLKSTEKCFQDTIVLRVGFFLQDKTQLFKVLSFFSNDNLHRKNVFCGIWKVCSINRVYNLFCINIWVEVDFVKYCVVPGEYLVLFHLIENQ